MPKKRDRWPELCKLVEQPDGLPTRDAGPWTEDKLYFWNRYVDITTTSMVGHPKWPSGLVYVDLFAGPGICKIEETGKRFPGSPLIAAHAPKPFRSVLLCELDLSNADALAERMKHSPARDAFELFRGDCNERVAQMAERIPAGVLTLAFIDPEGLHVWFETIATLAASGRVDLLILLADRMDIVRNIDLYASQRDSNLDRMLGPRSQWRQRWSSLSNRSAANICKLFTDEYQTQLRKELGYSVFRDKQMKSARGPLYRLLFASKHERGAEFWDKITKRDRSGQDDLF
jgi:three-Cys-motif partner protein